MFNSHRKLFQRLAYLLGAMFLFIAPVVATSGAYTWKDQSALLPYQDGVALSFASERQGQWLLSDGLRVYRFDGSGTLYNITRTARDHGVTSVSGIYSDGSMWLIASQPADRADYTLMLTDGETWNDISGKFVNQGGGLDASGANGAWYVRTYRRATVGTPASWDLYYWNGFNLNASLVNLPAEVAALQAGCFKYLDGSKLCTGVNAPVLVNGAWYFFGGSSEAIGNNGVSTQAAKGGVWTLNGTEMTRATNAPPFKFVSGLWPSKTGVLVATSNATTNPFAADHLWLFDGSNWKDVSAFALSQGLLSRDAREIRAAYTGRSWMILAGKKLIRFDGTRMGSEGNTRDLFSVLSSNERGTVVLGGVASDVNSRVAGEPLMARLATVAEDLTAAPVVIPSVTGVVAEVASKVYGPAVTTSGQPADPRIGNGKAYTFRASAEDENGVERTEIFVNGARVKSCAANVCEYTQKYWTNGAAYRKVELYAQAVDALGYVNQSEKTTLVVDTNVDTSAFAVDDQTVIDSSPLALIPAGRTWNKDKASQISLTSWLQNNKGVQIVKDGKLPVLLTEATSTYGVAAMNPSGIGRIQIWVNGVVKKNCSYYEKNTQQICSVELAGADYPYGTEVFMNANVSAGNGKSAWTAGTRLVRNVDPAPAKTPKASGTVSAPAAPAFSSVVSTDPSAIEVERGTRVKVNVLSQNTLVALQRVEVYMNGQISRACSYGAAVGQVPCDLDIDTSIYQPGTTLSFMAKAIDTTGHEIWSNARALTVKTTTAASVMGSAKGNGMSVWAWLGPAVTELSEGQATTYSIGSWSPRGLKKIEIIADGRVRNTCVASGTGSQECSFTIQTADYNHGHTVFVNARIMDNAGAVMWSAPRAVLIKRTWEPMTNPSPYVGVTSDRESGYGLGETIRLSVHGWSANGVSRMDLFVNGAKLTSCGASDCSVSTGNYFQPSLEYMARLIDGAGQEVWTPVQGIYAK